MAQGQHQTAGEVYGALLLLAAQQAVRLLEDARSGQAPGWAIGSVGDGVTDPRAAEVPAPWWREVVLVIGGARPVWCSSPHYRAWLAVLREAEGRCEAVAKVG